MLFVDREQELKVLEGAVGSGEGELVIITVGAVSGRRTSCGSFRGGAAVST